MENNELFKRGENLLSRCEKSCTVTHTGFLSPAERCELERYFRHRADCSLYFFGGNSECERTMAFFLPDYLDSDSLDMTEYISALRLTAYFGTPGHRDYMGAILGMGISRERLGDIWVQDSSAVIFCTPAVKPLLLDMEKAGRITVRAEEISLDGISTPEKKVKNLSFTVMSMRLDAIVGGMFNVSRTEAAKQISLGNVSINYRVSEKTDFGVKEGDIISLRGKGKGSVTGTGGNSRKGRLFVYAEVYL